MTLRLIIPENPSNADREAIIKPLREYNISRAGDPDLKPVAILLTDEDGNHLGGLWGKCAYDWLFIELFALVEECRGQGHGTMLMDKAEEMARANGCVGIWLDTYEFQARGFYENLGFKVCGMIDDHPVGQKRYFLQKRF